MAKDEKKGKGRKRSSQVWKVYDAGSELRRKNRTCPKCGPGYFLANHKDRMTCGKCSYTEMTKREK